MAPLFEFTDQVWPEILDRIPRLEMSWFFKDAPEERVTRSAITWSAHGWDRIGRKFPRLRELVVGLIFDSLREALPMFETLRGLRVCKIFAEHAGLWLFSLQDLAVVICSESKSPGDAVAIVHKALCVYHTREGPPYFQETFCGEVLDAFIFSKSTNERRARHVGIVLRWRLGLGSRRDRKGLLMS